MTIIRTVSQESRNRPWVGQTSVENWAEIVNCVMIGEDQMKLISDVLWLVISICDRGSIFNARSCNQILIDQWHGNILKIWRLNRSVPEIPGLTVAMLSLNHWYSNKTYRFFNHHTQKAFHTISRYNTCKQSTNHRAMSNIYLSFLLDGFTRTASTYHSWIMIGS
jgi:hypothetical protein